VTERRRTILVVDDEPAQRSLLGGFVESLGFTATEASSAGAALSDRRSHPFIP